MNTQKIKNILELVVTVAGAVVALDELYKKFEPEIKQIFSSIVDACKKIKQLDTNTNLKAIAN